MTIEGVNKIKKRLADGSVKFMYYTFHGRGAKCFWESAHRPVKHPYPRAFVDAYQKAMKDRREVRDDFNGIATRYLESPGFASLAKKR